MHTRLTFLKFSKRRRLWLSSSVFNQNTVKEGSGRNLCSSFRLVSNQSLALSDDDDDDDKPHSIHRDILNRLSNHYFDRNDFNDEKSESRLSVGNLDLRITEAALIKMFSPFGKLYPRIFYGILASQSVESRGVSLLSSTAPKSMQEARLAKEKMHARLACARPLVVRLASERYLADLAEKSSEGVGETSKAGGGSAGSSLGQMSRSARIAAIKNKLKALEEEGSSAKKQKHAVS